ncbi:MULTISPECIES: hypothetical protein [unclassified Streptomyces]|uniref:hypothetical protein n=1 Tax=unclassified Streptomyces TaxID=2593676 RepID=UPI002237174D|nr:hypothetical protein [Streptomyces sp. SHP 1-2]MCW5254319.1 hypothetical protein [Streptomyces sp. SHP 1-2]
MSSPTRRERRRRGLLHTAATVLCSALAVTGTQLLLPQAAEGAGTASVRRGLAAGSHPSDGFDIIDATWTTAHIIEKGILHAKDTGLVVTYLAPAGRNPGQRGDWVGIYEQGQLDTQHRRDWDWVCPNEHARCMAYGAAAIPAGDDGLQSGRTYTVAYWADGANESSGAPAATIDYVVPW